MQLSPIQGSLRECSLADDATLTDAETGRSIVSAIDLPNIAGHKILLDDRVFDDHFLPEKKHPQ